MSMNKQIQRPPPILNCSRHHEANIDIYKEIKTEEGGLRRDADTPEISISSAESLPLEIDHFTGLPKLPVELPPPSPDIEHRSINLQPEDQRKVLASALKMSVPVPGSIPQRKSVTFHEDRAMSATEHKTHSESPKFKERVSFVLG